MYALAHEPAHELFPEGPRTHVSPDAGHFWQSPTMNGCSLIIHMHPFEESTRRHGRRVTTAGNLAQQADEVFIRIGPKGLRISYLDGLPFSQMDEQVHIRHHLPHVHAGGSAFRCQAGIQNRQMYGPLRAVLSLQPRPETWIRWR